MKIFIECGISLNSPYNTGIQRVVRNIVRESESVGQQLGVECIPVMFAGNSFRIYKPKSDRKDSSLIVLLGIFLKGLSKLNNLLSKLPPKMGYSKLKIIVRPYSRPLYFKCQNLHELGNEDDIMSDQLLHGMPNKPQQEIASAEEPDVLLLLDSNWDVQMWGAVDKFRAKGGHVCPVLYDLIPFTHPETVEEHTRIAHTSWWLDAPLHVDSVMCISNTVRNTFLQWQNEFDLERKIPADKVGYFYLGSELSVVENEQLSLLELVSCGVPYFLVVGSIEPRKNHSTILDAFEILWQRGEMINLLIVGGHGWKSQNFIQRVEQHPLLNKHLFMPERVNDTELNCVYKAAEALIIASFEEGFGLPIVEACQRGLDVICSDIPVFHEVAGDRATYFDPYDPASLMQVIDSQISRTAHLSGNDKKVVNWITWRESAKQLFTRVLLNVRD